VCGIYPNDLILCQFARSVNHMPGPPEGAGVVIKGDETMSDDEFLDDLELDDYLIWPRFELPHDFFDDLPLEVKKAFDQLTDNQLRRVELGGLDPLIPEDKEFFDKYYPMFDVWYKEKVRRLADKEDESKKKVIDDPKEKLLIQIVLSHGDMENLLVGEKLNKAIELGTRSNQLTKKPVEYLLSEESIRGRKPDWKLEEQEKYCHLYLQLVKNMNQSEFLGMICKGGEVKSIQIKTFQGYLANYRIRHSTGE
jgi:hypothetical protein